MQPHNLKDLPREEVKDLGNFGDISPYHRAKMDFEMKEAKWLDSVIRPMVWKPIVTTVEKLGKTRFEIVARFIHFFVDYFWIRTFLKIRIVRNSHKTVLAGKGFRPGHSDMSLTAVTTRVMKRGVEVASQRFPVGLRLK